MAFPFLGLFIIFLSVAAYYRKRATAQQKKVTEDFWSREDQANQIRRKDISNLPYITIPLEKPSSHFLYKIIPIKEVTNCDRSEEFSKEIR